MRAIILNARSVPGAAIIAGLATQRRVKAAAAGLLAGFDALFLPTTTEHPTIAAVQHDPVGINTRLGTYTAFCNVLDMAAVAFPARPATDLPFGVMMVVPAFHDEVALDLAARFLRQTPGKPLACQRDRVEPSSGRTCAVSP